MSTDGGRLGLSLRNRSGLSARALATLAGRAEAAGFGHIVFSERYNDSIAYAIAAALSTRRSRLWTGVANIGVRHPVLAAASASVADDVSDGRFVLGLGVGNEWHGDEQFDTLAARPLGRVREYVEVVRSVLTGRVVNHDGPRYQARGVQLSFRPQRAHVPIHLAALGPRMIELAGEIADGTLVHLRTPDEVSELRALVAAGCARGDRDPRRFMLSALVIVCPDDDADAARATAREAIADYLGYDSYRRHLRRLGYEKVVDRVGRRVDANDPGGAAGAIPDELIDRFAVWGDAERCRRGISAFLRAGFDLVVLSPRPRAAPTPAPVTRETWQHTYEAVIGMFEAEVAG